ncbi:NAD-dependent epimerase/dehydratase family protein [Lentisphaerota bacterium WC36G]|nr:NAD-dependent epimerase/dehydratase family protein [Lentisphaerae bacterium WC36]
MTNTIDDNFFNNKNILITGGAGFIGSNIISKLLQLNANITCLDDFSTGSLKNIEPFFKNSNFSLIEGSICCKQMCLKAIKNIDYVLHQGAIGSVPRSVENPLKSINANTMGFVNILNAAKEAKVKRFVYASSSSVYGNNTDDIKTEENTGKILSPYAATKVTNELFAENFSRVYGIETVGLRYFNVFGPNQNPNGAYAAVIPKFILQLLKHQQPTINNNNGSFSRDFTYVENVVNANLLALATTTEKIYAKEEVKHNIFNIACGNRISLDELFTAIKNNLIQKTNRSELAQIVPIYGQKRAGDIPHSLANIAKAKRLLNYSVTDSFDQGIAKTVAWYIENINHFDSNFQGKK